MNFLQTTRASGDIVRIGSLSTLRSNGGILSRNARVRAYASRTAFFSRGRCSCFCVSFFRSRFQLCRSLQTFSMRALARSRVHNRLRNYQFSANHRYCFPAASMINGEKSDRRNRDGGTEHRVTLLLSGSQLRIALGSFDSATIPAPHAQPSLSLARFLCPSHALNASSFYSRTS